MSRSNLQRLLFPALCLCALTAVGALGLPRPAQADSDDRADRVERVRRAREVYVDLVQSPDHKIPDWLLRRAKAVAVFPHVYKGAVGFGGRYGKGVVSFRDDTGRWSPPAFFTLSGGSWGLQLGASKTELVLFFMTDRSVRSLLKSKFTLGGKAAVAAGPIGRSAEAATDARFNAEIYSYARSKGLFAGLSLEGARLAPDNKSNRTFYGENVDAQAILLHGRVNAPPAAESFMNALSER